MDIIPVRKRLERLRDNPRQVPKPLNGMFLGQKEEESRPLISKSTIYQKKIEKAMMDIDRLKKKMEQTSSFLSLYPELKAIEKTFLTVVEEAEAQRVDLPEQLVRRVKEYQKKIKI
ncbi:hypothetical protein HY643_02540 [Candidatus Woesearchaeota archaeon]|nr:hypothetical protein [Candidatus Woesearchaeota archaeon]